MGAILKFTTEKFGPWMFDKIVTLLRWGLFSLVIIGLWMMRLFKWIAWGIIFRGFFRVLDRTAMLLVVR